MKKKDLKNYLSMYKYQSGFWRSFKHSSEIWELKSICNSIKKDDETELSHEQKAAVFKICISYNRNPNKLTARIFNSILEKFYRDTLIKEQKAITNPYQDFQALPIPQEYKQSDKPDLSMCRLLNLGWDDKTGRELIQDPLKIDYILKQEISNPANGYWYHGTSTDYYHSIKTYGLDSNGKKSINEGTMENTKTWFTADFYTAWNFSRLGQSIIYRTPMSHTEQKSCNKKSLVGRKQATLAKDLECCLDEQGKIWYKVSECSLALIMSFKKSCESQNLKTTSDIQPSYL